MIYLIKVEYKDCTLLKIGYTGDDNWERRKIQYKLHNPCCQFLLTIPKGTEIMEKSLHYKFKHFLYPEYGNEWFYYSDEIIDCMKKITLDDLDKLPISPTATKAKNKLLLKSWKITVLLDYIFNKEKIESTKENRNLLLSFIKPSSIEIKDIFEDLQFSNHYSSISNLLWKDVEEELFKLSSPELKEFFWKYDQLTTYVDKLHMIVDYLIDRPETSEAIIGNLAESDKIKQQLLVLGPMKIRALGYNITYINRAMGITIFDKNSFLSEIYNVFIEGRRYTKKYIKEELGKIYKAAGFEGAPKASDIEEWFEIKTILVNDPTTKKREHGFELVKRKL